MPRSGRFGKYNYWTPFHITVDVGAADRIFTFFIPAKMQIEAVYLAAAAADSTDKVAPILAAVTASTSRTLMSSQTAVVAADTPTTYTTFDSGKSGELRTGDYLKVTLDFSGTAANVKGVVCTVWCSLIR